MSIENTIISCLVAHIDIGNRSEYVFLSVVFVLDLTLRSFITSNVYSGNNRNIFKDEMFYGQSPMGLKCNY